MKVLVTGSAGFIGFHIAQRFLDAGYEVVGYDGFTEYYDVRLKQSRDKILRSHHLFTSIQGMLEDEDSLNQTIEAHQPEIVVHLAAQAGVRYSIENPAAYLSSNIQGTFRLLEALRFRPPKHLLIASTSSIYGANPGVPFKETARTAFPMSLYAATKSSCEAMSHSYAHLFGIPTTCFRFFTVYGPWGRPDMALFRFVDRIHRGEEIEVYGDGEMSRDFTFIDDLVEGIWRLKDVVPEVTAGRPSPLSHDSISPVAPWRVVNIAGGEPVTLARFISAIERAMRTKAEKKFLPMQPGDVSHTHADPQLLISLVDFKPNTLIEAGVTAFVDWYEEYQSDKAQL